MYGCGLRDDVWGWMKMKTMKVSPSKLDSVEAFESVEAILTLDDSEIRETFGLLLGNVFIARFRLSMGRASDDKETGRWGPCYCAQRRKNFMVSP